MAIRYPPLEQLGGTAQHSSGNIPEFVWFVTRRELGEMA
jgi:hypothetical protein